MGLVVDKVFVGIYVLVLILINIYAIQKERESLNCQGFTIKKQCDELNSSYLKDALPKDTDTKTILENKLFKLISITDNTAYWRRCFILATIICIVTKLFCNLPMNSFVALHLVITGILYFYHNFMNFHVYKLAMNVGSDIIRRLRKLD